MVGSLRTRTFQSQLYRPFSAVASVERAGSARLSFDDHRLRVGDARRLGVASGATSSALELRWFPITES